MGAVLGMEPPPALPCLFLTTSCTAGTIPSCAAGLSSDAPVWRSFTWPLCPAQPSACPRCSRPIACLARSLPETILLAFPSWPLPAGLAACESSSGLLPCYPAMSSKSRCPGGKLNNKSAMRHTTFFLVLLLLTLCILALHQEGNTSGLDLSPCWG